MGIKVLKLMIIVLGLVAVAVFVRLALTQKAEKNLTLPSTIKLELFQGKNPPYNFTFEYPQAWRVTERGYAGNYDMVEVMGVVDKSPLMVPGIFITKKPLQDGDTLHSLMDAWIKEESRYKQFKTRPSKTLTVGGHRGLEVDYSYTLPLPPWTSGAQDVLVKKRQIVFIKGNASFQIAFMGTEEQFKTYKPILTHVLRTLKFLD